jgi:hypothetical protein
VVSNEYEDSREGDCEPIHSRCVVYTKQTDAEEHGINMVLKYLNSKRNPTRQDLIQGLEELDNDHDTILFVDKQQCIGINDGVSFASLLETVKEYGAFSGKVVTPVFQVQIFTKPVLQEPVSSSFKYRALEHRSPKPPDNFVHLETAVHSPEADEADTTTAVDNEDQDAIEEEHPDEVVDDNYEDDDEQEQNEDDNDNENDDVETLPKSKKAKTE